MSRSSPTDPASPPPRRWQPRPLWFALGLVVVAFAVYQPVWHADFIWDDDDHLTANPHLLDAAGLGRIWSSLDASRYYPLTLTTFWVQRQLWGLQPRPYHVVNVAVHVLGGLALWWVLRRLRSPAAEIAAALWVLHPVNVESVAWITELKNTQSGLFFFLAIGCCLRFETDRRRRWYVAALLAGVAALLSKPSTVVLPAVLLLCLWWHRGRWITRDWLLTAPFFLLSAAMSVVTVVEQRGHIAGEITPAWDLGLLERILLGGRAIWFYAGKLVWPVNLTFVYPRWTIDAQAIRDWLPLTGLLAVAGWLWVQRRAVWARAALVGGGCFGVALLPVSGLFDVYYFLYSFVADHFQYLASAALIALVTAAAARGLRALPRGWITAGTAALVGTLGILSWRQCGMYANNETLWRVTIARNPVCWMAHNNLGNLLARTGRVAESIGHYEAALRIKPGHANAHTNLGIAFKQLGRLAEAVDQFERALRADPTNPEMHTNLATTLLDTGQRAAAIAFFERALQLDPNYAEAHNNLGNARLQDGDLTAAIGHFQQAARLRPDDPLPLSNLARALAQAGRSAEAITSYQAALRLSPQYAAAHHGLGLLLGQSGRFTEAVAHFEEAVRLDPQSAETHANLGFALHGLGRWAEAVTHYQAALRLKTDLADAHCNWGATLAAQGQWAAAREHFHEALRINPQHPVARRNLDQMEAALAKTPAPAPPTQP